MICFPQLFMKSLWVTRLVSRMNGLARPSLEPVRRTEYETVAPSSVILYVRMAENTEPHCTHCTHSLFKSHAPHPFLSVLPLVHFYHPPSPLSLCFVYTPSSHMYCYLVVLAQDVAELRFVEQQIKTEFPSGIIRHCAATMNLNCFLLHRIPSCFIIKCKVMAKTVNWHFLHTLLIILYCAQMGLTVK